MQPACVLAALALLCNAAPAGARALRAVGDHPVTRVISLLQGLSAKVEQEGKAEEVTYAKYETWCGRSIKSLQETIAAEKEKIASLDDTVDAKTKENATFTEQIAKLSDEILKYQIAGAASQTSRDEAAGLYSKSDEDLAATVTAIEQAITALVAAKTTSTSLVQVELHKLARLPLVLEQLTGEQREALLAPGDNGSNIREDILARGDLAKHTKKYSFKSGNVVELLKTLKAKFEDDRLEGTKAETNSLNAFNLAKNARDSAIAAAGNAKAEKTTLMGECQSDLATAKKALQDTREDLQADEGMLSDTKKSCSIKATEWNERSKIREQELKAMAAGIDIMSKVTGVRTEAPKNPVLPPSPVFVQLSSGSRAALLQDVSPRARAINLLRAEARRSHSKAFERFAEAVAARVGGPFDDLNNMIQKMIFRLMNEQKDEDDHKNWCDLELEKTNSSKASKEEKMLSLDTKIADATATADLLAREIVTANEMLATLTAHMQEATETRKVGKEENAAAIQDAKDAQNALTQATSVLQTFYKDSGMVAKESWEFLQRKAPLDLPAEPSTWESAYTGVADPTKQPAGIIAVLKEISADFAKMEADTMAQEQSDQKAYDDEMKDTEIEKARRSKESEMKGQEKARLLDKIVSMKKSKKHVSDELDAVNQYLKDLEPACVDGDSTYEDRKLARSQEIEALKEAQIILADAFKPNGTVPAAASFLQVRKPASSAAFLASARP